MGLIRISLLLCVLVAAQIFYAAEARKFMASDFNILISRESSLSLLRANVESHTPLYSSRTYARDNGYMDETGLPTLFEMEEEEEEERPRQHPADRLLQFHKADATKSYILGGY